MNNILAAEHLPVFVSMRKSALRKLGGSLSSLWTDSRRFDSGKLSRDGSGCRTRKDYRVNGSRRDYKPWRRQKPVELINEVSDPYDLDPYDLEIFN